MLPSLFRLKRETQLATLSAPFIAYHHFYVGETTTQRNREDYARMHKKGIYHKEYTNYLLYHGINRLENIILKTNNTVQTPLLVFKTWLSEKKMEEKQEDDENQRRMKQVEEPKVEVDQYEGWVLKWVCC